MDALAAVAQGPPADKLKSVCIAQLGLSLFVTVWAPGFSAAVAVLGLVAVSLSAGDLGRVVGAPACCRAPALPARPAAEGALPPQFFYAEAANAGLSLIRLVAGWRTLSGGWLMVAVLLADLLLQVRGCGGHAAHKPSRC